MVEDLVKIWPLVLALTFVIALVVRIDAQTRENAVKIREIFRLYNEMIARELSKKDKE